jgi:FlaA1/EpsC-like NDP-sugar epimerase
MRELAITFVLATVIMWSVRMIVKYMYEYYKTDQDARGVFIYGVKTGGLSIARALSSPSNTTFKLKGFISDADDMIGKRLMGVKVYENNDKIIKMMELENANTLFVSPLKRDKFVKSPEMVDAMIENGIAIYTMDTATKWDGKSDISTAQLKEIDIEDLLPRDEIEVDMDSVGRQLTGNCIMVTGSAGSIGSEMVRQIAQFGPKHLALIDAAETPMHDLRLFMKNNYPDIECETIVSSITHTTHMNSLFERIKPDYVFHAAAYKHVPMMEDNPSEAVFNNIFGTRVIADLAVKYGTKKFVMISTDKAVNPTNVMGCSKRICEIYCQALNKAIVEGKVEGVTQFVTTRFGNVLGSNGSVIPIFREQIKKGGPVTVTHPDIIRFFMLIPEACKLVLEAGTMGKGGEIFVFDMGKPVRIADLAKRMIKLSGAKNVEVQFTGLRDGEKLYEEVLNDAETTKPTVHKKIMVASVREYEYEVALANEERLYEVSRLYDDMKTVRVMKEIVPEFKSRQSKYEAIDAELEAEEAAKAATKAATK